MHTNIHTHTHRRTMPIFNACGLLPAVAAIWAKNYWGDTNLEKHGKWHHFRQGSWKAYYHLYANEQVKPNPPVSVPEAITWIEIISSSSVKHIDTSHDMGTYTGPIQWMLNISSSENLLHLTYGTAKFSKTQTYWLPGSSPDLCDLEQSTYQTLIPEIFTITHAPPTHKRTHRVAMFHEY
jgi:hypothetical protein